MVILLLLTACADPECGFGYVYDAGAGDCVPLPDGEGDTSEPEEDSGTPGAVGTLDCEGLHVESATPVAREVCGECDGAACAWTVLTAGPVGRVELDLRNQAPPGYAEPWTEYHDAFTVLESSAAREVRTMRLAEVEDLAEYASGTSTWIHLDDPETLANLSLQVSVSDVEGVYLDCFAWGLAPESFTGDCPVAGP